MLAGLFHTFSSFLFLCYVLFTIPLNFDIGGRTCGLAYSLTLAAFYFCFSILRLATPNTSRFRWCLVQLVTVAQWLILPALMIWSLNVYSVDEDVTAGWTHRTFDRKRAADESVQQWLFGRNGLVGAASIGIWDKLLRWSVPFFQFGEGFCSLLVIQSAGQIVRWLINGEHGDNWMIGLLVMSASIISSSVYFLYRITTFPDIGNVDAILIGAAITCAIFLCAWGIGSGRGNPIESSLLFAYITLCIYQIFTDYQPGIVEEPTNIPSQPEFPPLPPIIMASFTTITQLLSVLPSTITSAFNFIAAAIMTITPSVIISLAYRTSVMYASTRIIPAVRDSGARDFSQAPSLDDSDGLGRLLGLLRYFSPTILISVYTSLLMQHFATTSGNGSGEWWTIQGGNTGGNIWRWANLASTMLLYALELYLGKGNDDLISHWKVD